MTERIEDPAQTPTVLVGHLGCRSGTGLYCAGIQRIRVIDNQQRPTSRAADRGACAACPKTGLFIPNVAKLTL
jgi:hypothetical protein